MRWELLARSRGFRRSLERLREHQQSLDYVKEKLRRNTRQKLQKTQEIAHLLLHRLAGLNPARILQRGYSVLQTVDEKPIRSTRQVAIGDRVRAKLHEGRLLCDVKAKEEDPSDGAQA